MLSDFWSELFGSVGSLLNNLSQGRRQQEFVFLDSDSTTPDIAADLAAAQTATQAPSMWAQAKAQLESLQKADPNFLESTFLTQAAKTYGAALAAEGAMDTSSLSGLVTPAFLERVNQRISDWRSGGFSRVVSDVSLDNPSILKVSIGGESQALTVRFTGTAKRFTKEDMTNLVTEGSAQADSFTEFATFVRPAGSTTPQAAAAGGTSHCPSCGAPVQDGALTCTFCGAPLSGTGGTWLLDHTSTSAYT